MSFEFRVVTGQAERSGASGVLMFASVIIHCTTRDASLRSA
jgi:hypothetical protein